MIYVLLPSPWLRKEDNTVRPIQLECSLEEALEYNAIGYNVYYYPNSVNPTTFGSLPLNPRTGEKRFIKAEDIDIFEWIFADLDMKHGAYESKQQFLAALADSAFIPTKIIDSGNGIHAYWRIIDLDAKSFLSLTRRIARFYNTDLAVCQIKQLMRVPGTLNTKDKDNYKICEEIFSDDASYTCEELDKLLPPISREDEEYCTQHFDKTYNLAQDTLKVDDKIPDKFHKLVRSSKEVKDIWAGNVDDRSKADFRLGHIMFAHGFTKQEALSVLINSPKALSRAPQHRVNYASNIVDKIWTYELETDKNALELSNTVKEILNKHGEALKGERFPCWPYLDATHHGFRLGQVIGLVAGSGVGKTAMALNMFEGFVHNNPDYDHFFIPLEQPVNEIADRWKTMCGDKTHLHDKVHVISNYAEDGSFRHLSFEEIKTYLLKFQEVTKRKIGCVVIDHIGALKKAGKDGKQNIEDICHEMKAFAIQTNTLLVMQSQTSREKAGIGDLELNKDAAYGTVYFESYCDYLITIWQPLKRCYSLDGCPTVTAFKFCKIRHKKRGYDSIQEDVCYRLFFDPNTEHLRELTQLEEKSFEFFKPQATNLRKKDRKTDLVEYKSMDWTKTGVANGKAEDSKNIS